MRIATILIWAALSHACRDNAATKRHITATTSPASTSGHTSSAETRPACPGLTPLAVRHDAASRIVAIGDLHGDLNATLRVLKLANLINAEDDWIGGATVLVQTGDVLDRGDDEQDILDLLERLRAQAQTAGGQVHVLLGNHETMNVAGDFRYVTAEGWSDFDDAPGVKQFTTTLQDVPATRRARIASFRPGGYYARILGDHNIAVIVGDTVFVHGGLRPQWARVGLHQLNSEARCWLHGARAMPESVRASDGPLWSRHYSAGTPDCGELNESLQELGARRMVVGHTPQLLGITNACDGAVWRIDVGMAAYYGGPTQALEITGRSVRILKSQ